MKNITIKTIVALVLFSIILGFIYMKNKDASKGLQNNLSDKKIINKAKKQIDSIKQASIVEDTMMDLIIDLVDHHKNHKNIRKKLSDTEIEIIEKKLNVTLPNSYKLFLKYFGDGADLIHNNSISSIHKTSFLSDQGFNDDIELNDTIFKTNRMLSLTNKDTNGGAWYWLTDSDKNEGEWTLGYFNTKDKTLQYTINGFTEWMQILVESKSEVISKLKEEDIVQSTS